MHLFVVRHGQPFDESITGGNGDPALTDLGHEQAAGVTQFLAKQGIDHVVSSPLVRARQTAEPLAQALSLEIEFDDDLKEAGWQLGKYERVEENIDTFLARLADDPEYFYRPEGREKFAERVMGSFSRIASANSGKRVAVFCHGMVTTTLAAHCLRVVPGIDQLQPDYSSLTRVQASPRNRAWTLLSFNETMHLDAI